MRLTPIILFLLCLSHCATRPKRAPAQAQATSCAVAFEQHFGPKSDLSLARFAKDIRDSKASFLALKAETLPALKLRLEKAEALGGCERQTALAAVAFDIHIRLQANQRIFSQLESGQRFLSNLQTSPLLNDPAFPNRVACLWNCLEAIQVSKNARAGSAGDGEACSRKCKIDLEHDPLVEEFGLDGLIGSCADHGTRTFQSDEFSASYKHYVPPLKEIYGKLPEAVQYLEAEMKAPIKGLVALDERARADLRKPKAAIGNCPEPVAPSFAATIWKSVPKLTEGNGWGTGFWIELEGKPRLVTAYHVYDHAISFPKGDREFPAIYSEKPGAPASREEGRVYFTIEPGRIQRLGDLILGTGQRPGPALTVNDGSKIPKRGDRFYFVGFPASDEALAKIYPCSFLGFVGGQVAGAKKMSAIYSCSGNKDGIEGMSGGPVVDEAGVVWAVVTNYDHMNGNGFATPILIKSGELIGGYGDGQMSDDCLRDDDRFSRFRCQLIDNPD